MEVSSILNWVIAISLIGMVFGYFVLVLSTQRHNPVSWIGLTAMGLIATVAAVGLVLAQVHSVDVVRSGGFLWILFAIMVIQLIPQWTMTKMQRESKESHHSRSEEHTSELQSHLNLVCRLLLEKKKVNHTSTFT